LYRAGLITPYQSGLKVVSVGNLSVGGTGKTPFIEYIISKLGAGANIAVISRGYGRNTRGMLEVQLPLDAKKYGDEPSQLKYENPNVLVVVSEARAPAVKDIEKSRLIVDVVLLDDAFQHLAVNRSLNIMLTTYENPFFRDYVLPTGTLREFRTGAIRADIIIVTKCPELESNDIENYKSSITQFNQAASIFFTKIRYAELRSIYGKSIPECKILLLTSIANAKPLRKHLLSLDYEIVSLELDDHFAYATTTISQIKAMCKRKSINTIITTGKDEQKLSPYFENSAFGDVSIFVADIETKFIFKDEEDHFLQLLLS
jgi:tetraacyldisaccharide 4'-kinase